MKRAIRLISQAVIVLLVTSGPALAWEHHGWHYYRPRVVVGFGPWWGPSYAPWGYYPPYAAAYPPPVVIAPQPQQQPLVYVERQDGPPPEAQEEAAPAPQEAGPSWYYCPGAREYYPKVERCSEQWVRVPGSAE